MPPLYAAQLPGSQRCVCCRSTVKAAENRTRYRRICTRVSEEEFRAFDEYTAKAKLSKDAYLRGLISGVRLKPAPSEELLTVIRQLQRIGNNINQIAVVANKSGHIDTVLYKDNYRQLLELIDQVMDLLQDPVPLQEVPCR